MAINGSTRGKVTRSIASGVNRRAPSRVVNPEPVTAIAPKPQFKHQTFLNKGFRCPAMYAVVVVDHPKVVKVGQTANWPKRQLTYRNWNLANGDGLLDGRLFEINEEWVDLLALEAEVLSRIDAPLKHGNEWFLTDIEEASRVIDQVMVGGDVSYTLFHL